MSNSLKSAAAAAVRQFGGLAAVRWFNRYGVRILMYHRFSDRAGLARQCAHIRRHYHPVSMVAISEWLRGGRNLPPNALAVTVDDGYSDFEDAGYPVFAEYAIPVTVFLVTDFIDGRSWLWFDRVVDAFRQARVAEASVEMPGQCTLRFRLDSADSRLAAGRRVAGLAVALSQADRCHLVDALPLLLETEIPEKVPPEYGPLSWDQVRTLASSGVEFGAHTKTHPILSALTDPADLREEIGGSKARIESQLQRPVLHFCYPNGKMPDIGPAAEEAVRVAGMQTAVTAEPGLNQSHENPWLLLRIDADPSHTEMFFERRICGWL